MVSRDSNRFNAIVVIDSIPTGELNTARRIHEDLETYAAAYPPSPKIGYVRVAGRDELFSVLSECCVRAERDDYAPLLHIECHGDDHGFQLADGAVVDWAELKQPLTELNVAMRLNLMIIVAACTGGALASVVGITDRAPIWGLIGPTKVLSSHELERAYGDFYRTLLSSKSPSKAIEALEGSSEPGLYWRTTAQGLFEKAWALYRQRYCTPEQLNERATRMREILRQNSGRVPEVSAIVRALSEHEPQSFHRFRHVFFMHDLYPEHVQRFDVPYTT